VLGARIGINKITPNNPTMKLVMLAHASHLQAAYHRKIAAVHDGAVTRS
jgi:hypothetical protein